MFCISKCKQLNFFEQVSELNKLSYEKPVQFLQLLEKHFDINVFIPKSFFKAFYSNLGKNRTYSLASILSALLIMHILKIPSVSLLSLFINFSPYIKEFCGFDNTIPDDSYFSNFKTTYTKEIGNFFSELSLTVIPICQEYDALLPTDSPLKGFSSQLIYDTSGLKPQVKENNPKTLVSEINKQKNYAKIINNPDFNPYAAAYKNMPKFASANPLIKLDFVNGHFGYFYKFGIVTNGAGIPMRLHFFDEEFYNTLQKSSFETPEEQKYSFDNASLREVLFPMRHIIKNNNFTTFLGDSEFDSYDNYGFLQSLGFKKVFIPLNNRNSTNSSNTKIPIDEEGTPLCPKTKDPFLPDGSCKGKNRSFRLKYVCPLSFKVKGSSSWHNSCEDKCRKTNSTVTTYTYPSKDFRLYPGVQRCSDEWSSSYKGRTIIEREISSLKKNYLLASPRTTNISSMKSDLYLAASARLITVILAHAINKPEYMRNTFKISRLKIA